MKDLRVAFSFSSLIQASYFDYCEVLAIDDCLFEPYKASNLQNLTFAVHLGSDVFIHKAIVWPEEFSRDNLEVGVRFDLKSIGWDQPDDRNGDYRK